MAMTRRSIMKLGLGGMLVAPLRPILAQSPESMDFDAWRRDFEASMPARMRGADVPGLAIAITSPDSRHYSAAFGMADIRQNRSLTVDTPMHLASVSKLATSVALVQLFERRRLDLHAPLERFIGFSVRHPHHPGVSITPHHLLTHTSGISDEGYGDLTHPGDSPQKLAAFLAAYLVEGGDTYSRDGSFQRHAPGTHWSYSNVAMALAGHVVEAVSGQDFPSYVETHVFAPLHIDHAHWSIAAFGKDTLAIPYLAENGTFTALPQQGYPDIPAGMLRCPVNQLATLLNAMLPGNAPDNGPASREALENMLRNQLPPSIKPYQGLGWIAEDAGRRHVIGHSGSDPGASNMVALTADRRRAVIVLMNVDGSPRHARFRDRVTRDLLAAARQQGPVSVA